jgi:HEAT repeat protein
VKPEGEAPVPIGILTVDVELVVRTWDGWLADNTGIASGQAVGRPLAAVVPSLIERGLLPRFEQVLATGEVQVLAPAFHHYLIPCPPRQPSPHFDRMQQRVTLGPLREGDRVTGVMATVEDVTARIDRERALANDLRADDWRVRRDAVRDLSREAHPDLLVSLLAALRTEHRDFNVLSSALQLLGASDVDVSEPLAALLRDPDAGLRMQAALALGERQTPAAVEALIAALQDPDANVQFHAIEALGRMRAADAVDALADIADGDDFFLVFPAIDALAHIHDPRVAPRLLTLLRRADVIEPVADALGELGGAEAISALVAALNTTGPAAPLARALARIHQRYEQYYEGGGLIVEEFHRAIAPAGSQRILDAVATGAGDSLPALVTVLGWLRGPAVERALARLLGDASVRAIVIEAIARRGADTGIIDILVDQLNADDADVRLAAIVALGRLGDRRATAGLAAMLDGDRAEIVAAAAALARVGDRSAFESLLPLLSHDDAAVRQAAIGALNALGHPAMAERVAALLSSADARVRESAVRIAGYFGYRQCIDALIERAADPDEGVRRAAVEHLPFLDDPRAGARLSAAVGDGSAKVRSAAAQALAHVSHDAARGPLLAATADADPWVRYYAVRSLGEQREGSAAARLAELAGSDPAMHVRIAALEAIGSAGGASAADLLLPYVDAASGDLAAAALRALGRLDDPRAAQALAAALRSPDPVRRLAAVTGLRSSGGAEAVPALAWTAGADAEDSVSLAAVEALGAVAAGRNSEATSAIAALIGLTADPQRRDRAVTALARLPETRVAPVAEGLRHLHRDVRCATIDVLARMRHPDASAAIRSALDDAEAAVREAAITALDWLGARGNSRRFAQLAKDDPSRAVRRAAAAALGRTMDAPAGGSPDGRR